ncbi:hypothetical protein J5N97_011094 [Dioscorea zingiberensis]|uniref:Uncharacterized protein n=1 Tax=Dioscorea zingiberensis TaxID=325984 RepID=A0A9D5D1L5_9LILI|nr:hypothetical protein J5N97_011094 [Dioscorea zingiberensis]
METMAAFARRLRLLLRSTAVLYLLTAAFLLGSAGIIYSRFTFAVFPDLYTPPSPGCRPDGEGSWSVGMFYGESPLKLQPLESRGVWRNESAAWPVANPVFTCASASDAGSPNFSAFGAKKNGELEIWYSSSPLGPWEPHKQNPVHNTDKSLGARNAGRPFVYNGNLYRTGQDCGETYGRRIRLFQVKVLTPDKYEEIEVPLGIKEPKKGRNAWNGARYHHLDVQQLPSGEWDMELEDVCEALLKMLFSQGNCSGVEQRVWRKHPDRIVGFYPRLAQGNPLQYRDERYARKENGYNMILTGLAFIDGKLALDRYWSEQAKEGREFVDKKFNCEDALLNFLYVNASKPGMELDRRSQAAHTSVVDAVIKALKSQEDMEKVEEDGADDEYMEFEDILIHGKGKQGRRNSLDVRKTIKKGRKETVGRK